MEILVPVRTNRASVPFDRHRVSCGWRIPCHPLQWLQHAATLEYRAELHAVDQILPCLVFSGNFFEGAGENLLLYRFGYCYYAVSVTKDQITWLDADARTDCDRVILSLWSAIV